jgi:hypothetical protein
MVHYIMLPTNHATIQRHHSRYFLAAAAAAAGASLKSWCTLQ